MAGQNTPKLQPIRQPLNPIPGQPGFTRHRPAATTTGGSTQPDRPSPTAGTTHTGRRSTTTEAKYTRRPNPSPAGATHPRPPPPISPTAGTAPPLYPPIPPGSRPTGKDLETLLIELSSPLAMSIVTATVSAELHQSIISPNHPHPLPRHIAPTPYDHWLAAPTPYERWLAGGSSSSGGSRSGGSGSDSDSGHGTGHYQEGEEAQGHTQDTPPTRPCESSTESRVPPDNTATGTTGDGLSITTWLDALPTVETPVVVSPGAGSKGDDEASPVTPRFREFEVRHRRKESGGRLRTVNIDGQKYGFLTRQRPD